MNDSAPPAYRGPVASSIFVKADHRTYNLENVDLGMSMGEFVDRLKTDKNFGLDPEHVNFIFGGKQLDPKRKMSESMILPMSL
jgi:hypothetical protein